MKNNISLAGALLLLTCAGGWAQEDSAKGEGKGKWKTNWELAGDLGYDSNVFKLSPSGRTKLELNSPAYQASGRFKDMKKVDDTTFSPSLGVTTGDKKDLLLGLKANYSKYFRNTRLSYLDLGFTAGKKLGKRSTVAFKSGLTPSRYRRNYLADAIDTTGHVSPQERIYKAATYTEWRNSLEYKYRFIKQKKGRMGVAGSLLGGYDTRRYNTTFTGRDRNTLRAEAVAHFAFTKNWRAKAAYDYKKADSKVTREVLVLDEALFNADFNGNGSATDTNIRIVLPVDHSFNDKTISLGTWFPLSKKTDLGLSYKHLTRDYTSAQAIDPDHRSRTDKRTTLRFELDHKLQKGLHLTAGYENVRQTTNRSGNPASTGEVLDYNQQIVKAGLAYKF